MQAHTPKNPIASHDNIIIELFHMSRSSFSNPPRKSTEYICILYVFIIINRYLFYFLGTHLIFLMSISRVRRLLSSRIYVWVVGEMV